MVRLTSILKKTRIRSKVSATLKTIRRQRREALAQEILQLRREQDERVKALANKHSR
jgi:hypothetical protein